MAQQGNPFYVTPALATADVAGSLRGLGALMQRERQFDEQMAFKQEQQQFAEQQYQDKIAAAQQKLIAEQNKQQVIGNLTNRILAGEGDVDSMIGRLTAIDADLGAKMLSEVDEREQAGVKNYLGKLMTVPDEELDSYVQQSVGLLPENVRDDFEGYTGEQLKNRVKLMSAMVLPEAYKAKYEVETPKYQMGTGAMTGYNFNPTTGEFKESPQLNQKLALLEQQGAKADAKLRQSINKDFTSLTDDSQLIYNTAKELDKLTKLESGPASIAMVFKFMKALDPTSVVREGEFASAQNSAGVPESVMNYYNKLVSGDILPEKAKSDFIVAAKTLANQAIGSASEKVNSYLDTYENTLPKSFKELVKGRLPAQFEIAGQAQNQVTERDKSSIYAQYGVE